MRKTLKFPPTKIPKECQLFIFLISLTTILLIASPCKAGDQQVRSELDRKNNNNTAEKLREIKDSAFNVKIKFDSMVASIRNNKVDSAQLISLRMQLSHFAGLIDSIEESQLSMSNETQSNFLSIAVLIFGFLLVALVVIFQYFKHKSINYLTFRLIGVFFVGTVSVFLIPAGFENSQITPVVGLLGTLAGYLVGSGTNSQSPAADHLKSNLENK